MSVSGPDPTAKKSNRQKVRIIRTFNFTQKKAMDAQAANAKVNEGLSAASRALGLLASSVTRIKSEPSKIAFSTRMQELVDVLIDETSSLPDYADIARKAELFDVLCSTLSNEDKSKYYEQVRKLVKK